MLTNKILEKLQITRRARLKTNQKLSIKFINKNLIFSKQLLNYANILSKEKKIQIMKKQKLSSQKHKFNKTKFLRTQGFIISV